MSLFFLSRSHFATSLSLSLSVFLALRLFVFFLLFLTYAFLVVLSVSQWTGTIHWLQCNSVRKEGQFISLSEWKATNRGSINFLLVMLGGRVEKKVERMQQLMCFVKQHRQRERREEKRESGE